jgi:hypothetical protein
LYAPLRLLRWRKPALRSGTLRMEHKHAPLMAATFILPERQSPSVSLANWLEPHFVGSAGSGVTLTNTAPKRHLYAPGAANPISGMPIVNLQAAAEETLTASHLSHPLLRVKLAPTGCTAPIARAITWRMTNAAPSGETS